MASAESSKQSVINKEATENAEAIRDLLQLLNVQKATTAKALNGINAIHEKVQKEDNVPKGQTRGQLGSLYDSALASSQDEYKTIKAALEKVYAIRATENQRRIAQESAGLAPAEPELQHRSHVFQNLESKAHKLPLWIPGKPKEKPPPLCGSIPARQPYNAKPGDMVVALQGLDKGEEEKHWILAEVRKYNSKKKSYILHDVDVERSVLTVKPEHVKPLPTRRVNPHTNPEYLFAVGAPVSAMFPRTTCFYPGVVNTQPETITGDYTIIFDDSCYPDGHSPPMGVPQLYVTSLLE